MADADGRFEFQSLPFGRYRVETRCMGYEPEVMSEVLIGGARQTVLTISLREQTVQLGAVTVTASVDKARPLNPTAVAGAQMFSVEEAERFAGSLSDIARVVGRYVGSTGSTNDNGVSTHGNPPTATMYRIEGVEVPAPVHGTSMQGMGEISALHTDMLANGDYYTGAAPAEMGNTLGGVMDIRLRSGNNETFEHSLSLSAVGLQAASEGPLSRKRGSSYIASYRYGLSKLANDLGIGILDGDQGEYHDLHLKLTFPIAGSAELSAWGLGGWYNSYMDWDGWDEDWQSLYDQNDYLTRSHVLIGGLGYDQALPHGWNLRADLVAAHRQCHVDDRYVIYADDGSLLTGPDFSGLAPVTPYAQYHYQTLWLTASASVQHRFSSAYLLKMGASVRHIDYEHDYRRAASVYTGLLLPYSEADAQMAQVDAYATNNLRLGLWTLNAGLHLSGWTLCGDWTLQPRLSAQWKPADRHALSLAYGMTTRIEDYDIYFLANGGTHLKPIRSHQVVLDYKWQPSDNLNFTAEAWGEWQNCVHVGATGTFTTLNRILIDEVEGDLTNLGRGRNYGIAAGMEHFMADGFYWLLNAALYKAEYRDALGLWHPTFYDRGWSVAGVAGKEWKLGQRHLLSVDISATAMGGLRLSPYDEAASAARFAAGLPTVAFDESRAMENQSKPVLDLSLAISYRIHGRRADHILGFDYMNILANEEAYRSYYNYRTHRAQLVSLCYSLPNLSYSVQFHSASL